MPPTTRKQHKKLSPDCRPQQPLQQYDLPTSEVTETILKIATWNQNTRYSPTSAIALAIQNELDILTIQEPNEKITDTHTHEHTEFNNHVTKANYTAYYTPKKITLLRNATIQPYHRATHKPISHGRIHPLIITTSP